MKITALIISVAMLLLPVSVMALDTSVPDLLHGSQVAGFLGIVSEGELAQALDDAIAEALAAQRLEIELAEEERAIIERDKTNDTVAWVVWGGTLFCAVTNCFDGGKDGADGANGKDGKDGKDGKGKKHGKR
jgi:hypothetical protein